MKWFWSLIILTFLFEFWFLFEIIFWIETRLTFKNLIIESYLVSDLKFKLSEFYVSAFVLMFLSLIYDVWIDLIIAFYFLFSFFLFSNYCSYLTSIIDCLFHFDLFVLPFVLLIAILEIIFFDLLLILFTFLFFHFSYFLFLSYSHCLLIFKFWLSFWFFGIKKSASE